VLIILIPLWFILPAFARQLFSLYLLVQKVDIAGYLLNTFSLFFSKEFATILATQINSVITSIFHSMISYSSSLLTNIMNIAFQFMVFIFTFFFVLRDAEKMKSYFAEISPLSKATGEKFLQEFREITNSVVFGQILIGVIQGVSLGLGLWALGISNILFLTVLAIIFSIIPVVGAWLIWIPISLYLVSSGRVVDGIILFFYGLLFVSLIDNFLRPFLLSRKSNLNIFVAIIGTVGGLYSFGPIGLIIGPLIVSYLIIIIDFYRQGKLNELIKI
jgi:predicted PurR-regulated permease PerM